MAVDLIKVKLGQKILDSGCGVSGPMGAIAARSKAHVVGITINDYQVKRAKLHNKKAGLDSLCDVFCGNFLKMPFDENTFSIEATCHAPKLEEVYAEIYRLPGSLYVSYEWVTTDKYMDDDQEHKEVIQGIERGDALPGLRSYLDISATVKRVGFEIKPCCGCGSLSIDVAPKGTVDVHEMLFKTADYLTRGGETGIFTPMHMILCRKPDKASE
ncbi:hypothetical protein Bca52824_024968 [Brassica carinata]|uniref:Methyltransferase n=1 Tax=Brassica carinata TaxID=52824 RepID=A0A8X7VLE2_BRACI|nr:hypothetical protein Bca52824_024968 [Brassica carinata]